MSGVVHWRYNCLGFVPPATVYYNVERSDDLIEADPDTIVVAEFSAALKNGLVIDS